MSRFLDGPVMGNALMLRRAPIFLRVTWATGGVVDALDQLDDVAAANETIHVYRRVSDPVATHINFGGSNRSTGFYEMADYRHVPDVDGDTVRHNDAWRAWCLNQAHPPWSEA